jgi:hypothetical protein
MHQRDALRDAWAHRLVEAAKQIILQRSHQIRGVRIHALLSDPHAAVHLAHLTILSRGCQHKGQVHFPPWTRTHWLQRFR